MENQDRLRILISKLARCALGSAAAAVFLTPLPSSADRPNGDPPWTQDDYLSYPQQMALAPSGASEAPGADPVPFPVHFDGRYVLPSPRLPMQLQYLINAANCLQDSPYGFGAGHRRVEDLAYDCSSATSYALIKAGLLQTPLTSAGFANYGAPGQGRFITIWVRPGDHVFMTVCGIRLDTSGGRRGSEGPRWRSGERNTRGFRPRHPPGY